MWSIVRHDGSIVVGLSSLSAALERVTLFWLEEDRARVVIGGVLFARRVQTIRVLLDGQIHAVIYAPPRSPTAP